MSESILPGANRFPEDNGPTSSTASADAALSPVKRALQEIRDLRARLKVAENSSAQRHGPIAIVGAGMRFPGGIQDAESLWEFLVSGKDAIADIPLDRWDWRQYYDANPETKGSMYAVRGGFLTNIDRFDAEFFGIAPREAAMLDPQQRLLHEVAWHALENAGISLESLRDNSAGIPSAVKTGIFLGLSNVDYYRTAFADDLRIDAYAGSGNSPSMAAGRLAYTLGVHGPAITVDTSCSSSLVAVHLAVQSLRSGESDVALAGGVNVILGPQMHIAFSRAHMLAPDGRCKTFDASADGYVRSEGCGVIVVKRLEDAVTHGDRILAVIRGSATNHDGRSGGLTAPSSRAQAALIREAHVNAGVDADSVQVIEAHGTGTSLGDPIEMEALGEVFRGRSAQRQPVLVGSIKTNLGHTEAASGIAGLLKLVVGLQHQTIPPHLHFKTPSTFIPWKALPVSIPTEVSDWRLEPSQSTRIAGVSSFGFSGSNAHVVLEEFVEGSVPRSDDQSRPRIAALSAHSPQALRSAITQLSVSLKANPGYSLGDVCGTLVHGRMHHAYRAAWTVEARDQLLQQLESSFREQDFSPRAISDAPSICFLFTGQGSEYSGMGLELFAQSPVFSKAIARLESTLGEMLGISIPTIWANTHGELARASLVQPALYAYGWALSELWRSWGVVPNIVLGHSLGEYIAATVAGVMTPEEGIALVAARGRLTETLAEAGGMISIVASPAEVNALLSAHPRLSIAAINGPSSVVVSGGLEALQRFEDQLESDNLRHKRLRTTHGFHSAALDTMLDPFFDEAAKGNYQRPAVRWISNVTGMMADKDRPVDAQYWRDHLRSTVQFSKSLATAQVELQQNELSVYLEIGAQPQLAALLADNHIPSKQVVASVRRGGVESEWFKAHDAAAQLYCVGVDLDWEALHEHKPYSTVTLPGYPFERKRYWLHDNRRQEESIAEIMADAILDQSEMVPMDLVVDQIAPRTAMLNRWAKSLMVATLKQLVWSAEGGQTPKFISIRILEQSHGLVAGQARLVERWFKWLSEDGYLVARGEPSRHEFVMGDVTMLGEPSENWKKLEPLLERDAPQKQYLIQCDDKLLGVLRGAINPLETLFPKGDETLARDLYEKSSAAIYLNSIVAAAVAARAGRRSKTTMGYARRLRVLEIGAGTGATTASILKKLSSEDAHYTFSDISEVFLARGRQRYRGPAVDFVRFDLDRDEDSFASAGRYDLVVIANALHVAKDLRASLKRIARVLQPGGSLVLLETTVELAWSDVSIGMIEGWQHFKDEARTDSPLLPVDRWMEELALAGFERGCFAPSPHQPTSELGLHVLIAHRPVDGQTDSSDSRSSAEAFALTPGRYAAVEEGYDSSAGNLSQINPEDESSTVGLREELSGTLPKERLEFTTNVVRVAVAKVLGHKEWPTKDARLMELGMDSLMAMELRNNLQRTFAIPELSTTLMFDYPTASAIAAFLLSELGYAPNGEDVQLVSFNEAIQEPRPGSEELANLDLHSTSDLDAMSDDEIADLLRARLGV